MLLRNILSKEALITRLNNEAFNRKTLSFYRYVQIENPELFRDELYVAWDNLQCYGRVYVAHEGINAQMSVPDHQIEALLNHLNSIPQLANMPVKWAVDDNGKSFLKLIVRGRSKIVADGLNDAVFDVSNVGNHLSPMEFHELVGSDDVVVVDMRNNYESEVGRFVNAICPDASTFREEVEMVVDQLANQKDKKILLYCTGGVRCEKASSWLRHHGFSDVNQLHGGIIAYTSEIRKLGLEPKFIGKNFVFDERLGERITHHILSRCHQCGEPCDAHTNCAYDPCHKLVIQCKHCSEAHAGCCSDDCHTKFSEKHPHHSYKMLEAKLEKQPICQL